MMIHHDESSLFIMMHHDVMMCNKTSNEVESYIINITHAFPTATCFTHHWLFIMSILSPLLPSFLIKSSAAWSWRTVS